MKTIVYISRHSEPFRKLLGEYKTEEIEQIRNEKNMLSVHGEMKAKKLSECEELQSIDYLCSSHTVYQKFIILLLKLLHVEVTMLEI